jgi:hypothetical protein
MCLKLIAQGGAYILPGTTTGALTVPLIRCGDVGGKAADEKTCFSGLKFWFVLVVPLSLKHSATVILCVAGACIAICGHGAATVCVCNIMHGVACASGVAKASTHTNMTRRKNTMGQVCRVIQRFVKPSNQRANALRGYRLAGRRYLLH